MMTELKKIIQDLITRRGGANVTATLVCQITRRNHASICKELGVERFGEYMDKLSYKVFLSDSPSRMRPSDRKKQMLQAGLTICDMMSFEEITGSYVTNLLEISPALFWSYFDSVDSFKEQVLKLAEERGVTVC